MSTQEAPKTTDGPSITTKPSENLLRKFDQLEGMGRLIGAMGTWMGKTLIRDDSFAARQYALYDMYTPAEEGLLQRAVAELGDRLLYVQSAYNFPDAMLALQGLCVLPRICNQEKPNKSKWRSKSDNRVRYVRRHMLKLRTDLDKFLEGPAKKAFRLTIAKDKSSYSIQDLPINEEEMRQKWDELLLSIGIAPDQLPVKPLPKAK